MGYLDSFGGLEEVREAYREEYDRLDHIRRQIASLQMDEAEKARRIDTLQFQIAELERANLQPGEEEKLEERKGILRSADQLMDAVGSAYYAVFGTDSQSGAASLLAEAESALSRVAALSGELSQLSSAVSELRYTTEDVAERLRDVRESLDFSPQELDTVESRLDHLHRLKKKYGALFRRCWSTWHAVRTSWIKSRWPTTAWPNSNSSVRNSWPKPGAQGEALSQKRRQAAETLKARIEEELRQLDMPKVRFEVAFSPKPGKLGLDETGMDEVSFLMSRQRGGDVKAHR